MKKIDRIPTKTTAYTMYNHLIADQKRNEDRIQQIVEYHEANRTSFEYTKYSVNDVFYCSPLQAVTVVRLLAQAELLKENNVATELLINSEVEIYVEKLEANYTDVKKALRDRKKYEELKKLDMSINKRIIALETAFPDETYKRKKLEDAFTTLLED